MLYSLGAFDLAQMWQSEDFADFVLNRNSLGIGAEWRYNSGLPNLLIKAIANMTGESVRDWASTNFYHKLGITDLRWQSQPDGYPEGAARMYIRPRDMPRIGITYMNDGMWDGEQVIPKAWVDDCFNVKEHSRTPQILIYLRIKVSTPAKGRPAFGWHPP